jgi:hypothetical protein
MAGDVNLIPGYRDDPDSAPFIHFDVVPTYGVLAGSVQIELAAQILAPLKSGGARAEFITVGHLRCTQAVAASLRDALIAALDIIDLAHTSTDGQPN